MDRRYVSTVESLGVFPPVVMGRFVSREQAINDIIAANEAPPDEVLRDGDDSNAAPAKPRQNLVSVYEAGTNKSCQLDTEAGPSWQGEPYGTGWGTFGDYPTWTHCETLYRRKGWILVDEQSHCEADIPCDPTFQWLTDEQAAEWMLRNGHRVPDYIAHHVAGRSLDDAEPGPRDCQVEREQEARLPKADFDELSWGAFFEPANERAKPATKAAVEAVAGNAVAVEPAPSNKVAGATKVSLPPDEELNVKAREILLANPEAGCRRIGEAIGCSGNKVRTLSAYIAVENKRKELKAPKAQSFTDALAESIGDGEPHKVLNDLIAEQTKERRDDEADRRFMGKAIGRRRKP